MLRTYILCKRLIELGKTDGLKDNLSLFRIANVLTEAEYLELINMLGVVAENSEET